MTLTSMPGGGGGAGSFVSVDSEDRGAWCTWNDIDECGGNCARAGHPSGECCLCGGCGGVWG